MFGKRRARARSRANEAEQPRTSPSTTTSTTANAAASSSVPPIPPSRDFVPPVSRPPPTPPELTALPVLAAPPRVSSSLQMTFDFELDSPRARLSTSLQADRGELRTPSVSDQSRKSTVSVAPPVLPPIARVSSHLDRPPSARSGTSGPTVEVQDRLRVQEESDNISLASSKSFSRPRPSFDVSVPNFSFSRPGSSSGPKPQPHTDIYERPSNPGTLHHAEADGAQTLRTSTLPAFRGGVTLPSPPGIPSAVSAQSAARGFLDSAEKLPLNTRSTLAPEMSLTRSAPDLLSSMSSTPSTPAPGLATSLRSRSPNAPPSASSANSDGKASILTSVSTKDPKPGPTTKNRPNLSVSTMKSMRSARSGEDSPSGTVGTPYQTTSPGFPPPKRVDTRPMGEDTTAIVGDVSVPTHHSTAATPQESSKVEKSERRKTRLLNPMALLARRRAAQEDGAMVQEREAQEKALERQKDLAAVGVSNIPEDFDPRIKGKVIHDFSAPRPRRNFSWAEPDDKPLENSTSAPFLTASSEPEPLTITTSQGSGDGRRRSSHTPMFMEHLTENPDHAKRISSIQAERLENKEFLQRASHVSTGSAFSQESFVLPPFARRSQQLDLSQAAFFGEADSPRSSDRSSLKERDSYTSSLSQISPILNRQSTQPIDRKHSKPNPTSPSSPGKSRKLSFDDNAGSAFPNRSSKRKTMDYTSSPTSIGSMSPNVAHGKKEAPGDSNSRKPLFKRDSGDAPEVVPISPSPPTGDSASSSQTLQLASRRSTAIATIIAPPHVTSSENSAVPSPSLKSTSILSPSLASSQDSPELGTAETAFAPMRLQPNTTPRLIEKLPSATHPVKSASGSFKHHASNSSRFSFQMGDSAAEEQVLESRGRKKAEVNKRPMSPDEEDEDDYFDEDAIDDMDEIELQAATPEPLAPLNSSSPRTGFISANAARGRMVSSSDEDDDSQPTPLNPAHARKSSGFASLTVDTDVARARPKSPFYMQPQATIGYPSPPLTAPGKRAAINHDSANNTQIRAASGLSFASLEATATPPSKHNSTFSGPSATSVPGLRDMNGLSRPFSQATIGARSSSSEAHTVSTGGGFGSGSGVGDFKFTDTPTSSRPVSDQAGVIEGYSDGLKRRTTDSDTLPMTVVGSPDVKKTRQKTVDESTRHLAAPEARKMLHYAADGKEDEMYFDDGGFGADVNSRDLGPTVDESAFDDDSFLARKSATEGGAGFDGTNVSVREEAAPASRLVQDLAEDSSTMVGSHGPYPTFAMPNPIRAQKRDSHLMLENMILQEEQQTEQQRHKPETVPQRNPSEDAKRFGVSSKAPPLPAANTGGWTAMQQVSASLNAYHAALADAATQAAAQGRFMRQPSSTSGTARGASLYSSRPLGQERHPMPTDGVPQARDEKRDFQSAAAPASGPKQGEADKSTARQQPNKDLDYDPPTINFDFGFDNEFVISSIVDPREDVVGPPVDDNREDIAEDDDIIAVANSEALASDDEGFYGQEFGFYANARNNSGDVRSVNGGFFGEDGDDGLARNKGLKEPNLTPITERSEFSTRNSFIGTGGFGPSSAGPPSAGGAFGPTPPAALSRLPVSPLVEGEVTSFEQLRKLRANAFGGSNGSLRSDGTKGSYGPLSVSGPNSSSPTSRFLPAAGYFNDSGTNGGTPMSLGYSTGSSESSNRNNANLAHQQSQYQYHSGSVPNHQDSPHSAASSGVLPFSMSIDNDATPRKPGGQSQAQSAAQTPLQAPAQAQVQVQAQTQAQKPTLGNHTDSPRDGSPTATVPLTPTGRAGKLVKKQLAAQQKAEAQALKQQQQAQTQQKKNARKSAAQMAKSKGMSKDKDKAKDKTPSTMTALPGDSVTYVREPPDPNAPPDEPPRWVLERRRKSEHGKLELVGREVVRGGWI